MNKESILIVDDEPINISLVAEILSEKYSIKVATNAEAALAIIDKEKPELILLDIFMPVMDGYETCALLKKNPDTKNIPIIFITGKSDDKSIEKAYDSGGSDYISKPFKPKELLARVQKELQLASFVKNLEKRVEDEILKRAEHEKLLIEQSRLASMGEMIGNIAHQWRQPLNALSLVLGNLKHAYQAGRLDDAFMERTSEKSSKLIQRMSSTIDDFRDFFRPEKEKEEFVIEEAIEDAISLLEGTLEHHNIDLETELTKRHLLFGFHNELSQVILNIVNNAKDALIEKKIEMPLIKIKTLQEKEELYILIEDNGGGIAPDIIDRIFEPYFTTKEQGSGTGIGLHMSKTIIQEHMKGSLSVKNSDQGALFTIKMSVAKR